MTIPLDVLPPVSTPKHVAALICSTEGSLAQDRYLGRGIPFVKIGKRVRYMRDDVLAFLQANRMVRTDIPHPDSGAIRAVRPPA